MEVERQLFEAKVMVLCEASDISEMEGRMSGLEAKLVQQTREIDELHGWRLAQQRLSSQSESTSLVIIIIIIIIIKQRLSSQSESTSLVIPEVGFRRFYFGGSTKRPKPRYRRPALRP